jgi:archaellum biogenesis ATPase FlaH
MENVEGSEDVPEDIMGETKVPEVLPGRYSTGVVSFDAVLRGGVPIGTLGLMLGEEGAGASEFAFTSAAKLSMVRDKPDMMKFVFGDFYSHMKLPEKMTYISISRTRTDIQKEIEASFNPDLAKAFERHVNFIDFSYHYFKDTDVPRHWITASMEGEEEMDGPRSLLWRPDEEIDLFTQLIQVIEDRAQGGIVYIDSLTDLIINHMLDNHQMMVLLKGFQRVLHNWEGVVLFLLHQDVLPPMEEARFKDCFDAVLVFEWIKSQSSSKRQRYMHFEKFRGVMPVMDRESIIRFNTEVSYSSGFVVVNAERII